MTKLRIHLGPTQMHVERNGVVSRTVEIGAEHGPAECRAIGRDVLWPEIRPAVSFIAWVRHRLRMAAQRRAASMARAALGETWHQGPRPDLISIVPWSQAKYGQWLSVQHGVSARLIRREK